MYSANQLAEVKSTYQRFSVPTMTQPTAVPGPVTETTWVWRLLRSVEASVPRTVSVGIGEIQTRTVSDPVSAWVSRTV